MKKLVSLLVVLAMLMTMAPAVFAQEVGSPTELVLGEEITAEYTVTEYEFDGETELIHGYAQYTWTATEAGTLTIDFSDEDETKVWCDITHNNVNYYNINEKGGALSVQVEANDTISIEISNDDWNTPATFHFTATFTAAAAGLEGTGTQADPWVLETLEAVNGTFTSTEDDHYYMYEVTESGTYVMDSFSGCNIMVFIDEIVWGEQVGDPGAGFSVEAGQVIYLNMFYSFGEVGAYSAAFTFTAGEGTGSEGGEVEAPVGTLENPDTLYEDYYQITTDLDGYVYQWNATEDTLFVLEMNGDNWGYVILVERADGTTYEIGTYWGSDEETVPMAVIEVFDGDVLTLMVSTATREEALVGFSAYTVVGDVDSALEPYMTWNNDYSEASVNMAVLASAMYVQGRSNMNMTVNGVEYGLQSYGAPCLIEGNGEEVEVWNIVCSYPIGSSSNRHVVDSDGGEYTAVINKNQNYCFVYKATSSGTLTVTVGGEVWYYKISGTAQRTAAYSSTAETPVNSQNIAVHDGYVINVDVKFSNSYSVTDSGEIPVTFTFESDGEPAVIPQDLELGTNDLYVGGEGEYEKVVYVYTAETAGTVYFTVRAYYMNGGNDVTYAMSSYSRTNYTKMRIAGEELTGNPEVSVELEAGETVEVQLMSLNGDAYYVMLEVSEEDFYEAQDGDREQPIVLNSADLPTTLTVDALDQNWYQLGYDFTTGGELVFTGMIDAIYTVSYDEETEEFIFTPHEPVDGEVRITVTAAMCSGEVLLLIGNEEDTAIELAVKADYPLGHTMNPDELPINQTFDVVLEEGNSGYCYTWTATDDGKLVIDISGDNWAYEINGSYFSADDNGSDTVTLILAKGDKVTYYVETYYYDWDNWESVHPEGTLTVTTTFTAGEVSCDHSSTYCEIMWAEDYSTYELMEYCNICTQLVATYASVDPYIQWNEEGTEASFQVEVPAGNGYFCAWYIGGMALTVTDAAGNVVATPEIVNNGHSYPCTFVVPNETGATVTYTLTLSYPVGNQGNPAQLVIGDNEFSVEADNYYGYYFTWTATGDGDLVLYIEVAEGVVYDLVVYNENSYKQMNLEYDAVNGVITMPVSEGDVIQISVTALEDANGVAYPACDFNLVAAFEKAAPDVALGDVNGDGNVNATDAMLILRYSAGILTEEEVAALNLDVADFDASGEVNATDAMLVLRKSAGVA